MTVQTAYIPTSRIGLNARREVVHARSTPNRISCMPPDICIVFTSRNVTPPDGDYWTIVVDSHTFCWRRH